MVQPFKATVGRSRLTKSVGASEAAFTTSVKEQMQGIIDEYNSFIDYVDGVTPDIILEALKPTGELAQEYCPFRTGILRSSYYLEKQQRKGFSEVEIGFAKGGFPDYAVFVHENLEAKHEEPTRAKFLQSALEEDWPNVYDRIIQGIKEATGV